MNKTRLDVLIFERNLSESREKAKALIMAGSVYVNGVKSDKAGMQCTDEDIIEVRENSCPYVSRGGLKLKKALTVFDIDVNGATALDIGASTGGFTDCLLQNGAKKVYSVDVGYAQLAYKLRCDSRVDVLEKTNFRYLEKERISDKIDITVMDVSFISITKLVENLKNFVSENTDFVFLIKPQFETEKEKVGKNGVISDEKTHIETVKNVVEKMQQHGFFLRALDYSPVKGPKGNIEFISRFSLLEKYKLNEIDVKINETVKRAHEEL